VVGKGDEAPVADAKAEEEEETRGYPIAPCATKTTVISQNTTNITKMARELKEKDEATKSSETSNHVFHNTSCEMVNNQGYTGPTWQQAAMPLSAPTFRMCTTNIHTRGNNRRSWCISISHSNQGIQQLCPHQSSKNSSNQANLSSQSKKVPKSIRS
jgi:hypothetical protein